MVIYRLEIFHGTFYIPVCHGFTRQLQSKLGHAGLLAVVWDAYETFFKHDVRNNRRRCRAVRQKRYGCLRLHDCAVAVFTAFRADQFFLHIADTLHFCRGYTQLCVDLFISKRDHLGIAVRAESVFIQDRDYDIADRDVRITLIPRGFLLFCPGVFLHRCFCRQVFRSISSTGWRSFCLLTFCAEQLALKFFKRFLQAGL